MPRLTALSGVGVKGPACFLLEMAGRRIMLDLGRGPDGDRLPALDGIGPVDAILFSHGHIDHTGGLVLWDALGQPALYATRPTIALTRHEPLQQAAALEDCTEILGIPVETGACGHAPGAVWMRLGGEAGMVYTGDISMESTLFRASLPPPAQSMVFDASYGLDDTPLAEQIAAIGAAVTGPVLFPCPAGGRGLEMARHFLEAGHRVGLCPSHRQVAQTLLSHETWLTEGGHAVLENLLARGKPLTPQSPIEGVMIAASPNAESGVAQSLATRMAAERQGTVIFTGHLAEGLPSAAMVEAATARFMRWNVHPRLAEQQALMQAVRPRQALAAFCSPQAIDALRAATGWPISTGKGLEW